MLSFSIRLLIAGGVVISKLPGVIFLVPLYFGGGFWFVCFVLCFSSDLMMPVLEVCGNYYYTLMQPYLWEFA